MPTAGAERVCQPAPSPSARSSIVAPSSPDQKRRARSGSSAGNSISESREVDTGHKITPGSLRFGSIAREVPIRGETIRLGQLLKLSGIVGSGSDAKDLLALEQVLVNGEPEERRGRQLHAGDTVRVGEEELRVVGS